MKFFGHVLNFLDGDMPVPSMYGWFHLTFFALSIIAAVVLCKKFKNPGEKTVKTILLIFSLTSIFLEIYKQINYTFSFDGTVITADYQWYAFPFQFCSTPMYVALFAVIIKNQKIHKALCGYLATFSLFAGLCVMVYPAQVFIDTIGINIQTMICHGAMITVGVWLLYCDYIKLNHKTIFPAAVVFVVLVFVAVIMNEIAKHCGLLERETFNMFYISPHCEPSLPVYSWVQSVVPYPFCAIIYVVAFTLAAYLILLIVLFLNRVSQKEKANKHLLTVK